MPTELPPTSERRNEWRLRTALVALVAVVGAFAAAGAWQQENDQAAQQDRATARRGADLVAATSETLQASLTGAAGIAREDGTTDVTAFEAYADDLTSSSDLAALSLVGVVPETGRRAFEAETGTPIIDRGPDGTSAAPARPMHYPVVTVVPDTESTHALLGFDLLGDQAHAAAAAEAHDSGKTVFTRPVASQPSGARAFFIIRPIYRPGAPLETTAERRAELIGFVSTAYVSEGLADALTAALPDGTRFALYDGDELLTASAPRPTHGSERSVEAANRTWSVVVEGSAPRDHTVAILLGVVASLLLAGGLSLQLLRSHRHERTLRRSADLIGRTATLAEALVGARTIAEVGEVVTTLGRRPVRAAATSVGVIEGGSLRIEHGATVPDDYRVTLPILPLDAPLAFTTVASSGQPLLFADHAAYTRAFPDAAGPIVGARAILPLRQADGTTIGAMAHLWDEAQVFDDSLRSTLRTIADLTGQAIERARLEATKDEDARHTLELARLAQGLATSRSSQDVMTFLTEAVLAPLDATHAAVAVIEGDQLRRFFTPGSGTEELGELVPPTVPLSAAVPLAEAARTGAAVLIGDMEDARDRYPDLVDGWIYLGFAAAANLPLRDRRGELLGALGLAWDHPVDLTELGDRLATIAGIAGQTLDRALLSDSEHRLVQTLQESVLNPLPEHPGLRTAQRYLPAARDVGMGGDWYGGVVLPGNRYTVVVGDVAGHGITAVGQMAQLRAVIGALVALDLPVNGVLPLVTGLPSEGDTTIATAAIVQVDLDAGVLRYACAGHPPPLVRLPDGTVSLLEDGRQPLLGLAMEPAPAGETAFPKGSVLVCYTDGLIERRGESIDRSLARAADVLASLDPADLDPERVAGALLAGCLESEDPSDDVALAVVVRVA